MPNLLLKSISGDLPTSTYELVENGERIGMIQIRQKPSASAEMPKTFASHIYYEIDPQYQRKGYGKQILALGLIEAKQLGLKEVIITCGENNIESKKIIESNGGILEDTAIISKDGKKMLKYRIRLS